MPEEWMKNAIIQPAPGPKKNECAKRNDLMRQYTGRNSK